MSQIGLISEKTATWLDSLIDRMCEMVERGEHPDQALNKIACDENLTPEYIRILGRAYNTGVTGFLLNEKRGNYDDLKKAPVCHPEKVIKTLYKEPLKKKADTRVDDVYLHHPKDLGLYDFPKKSEYHEFKEPRGESSLLKEAIALRNYLASRAESYDYERMIVGEKIDRAMEELRNYYKSATAIHPKELEQNCRVFGLPAGIIMKHAGVDTNRQFESVSRPVDWTKPPYSTIQDICFWLKKYAELDTIAKDYKNYLRATDRKFVQLKKNSIKSENDAILKSARDDKKQSDKKERRPSTYGRSSEPRERQKKDVDDFDSSLAWHVLRANVSDVKLILTDLLLNDPIISQYEPKTVYRKFKQIAQFAPMIVGKAEALRPILRKFLATDALDPADIHELLRLDASLGMTEKRVAQQIQQALFGGPKKS